MDLQCAYKHCNRPVKGKISNTLCQTYFTAMLEVTVVAIYIFESKLHRKLIILQQKELASLGGTTVANIVRLMMERTVRKDIRSTSASWAGRARGPSRARGCLRWSLVIAFFYL